MAGEVVVEDGVIVAVDPRGSTESLSLGSHYVVPGFIDLHVHGGGGAQFNTSDVDEVCAVAAFHARHGTTALLATLVSAPVASLVTSLDAISGAMAGSGAPSILGAHLEGPFLSAERPGAMDASTFLAPGADEWRRLMLAGGGCVAMMTVAPELPGALELVDALVEAGVVVSLGHSGCGFDEALAVVSRGARSVTHLFNAMGPLGHRAPGLVGAALDCAELDCELICDGLHVDPAVMRLARRAKGPGGLHLVTDAIAAAGMDDGVFGLGPSVSVEVRDGRAVVAGTDVLAGSTLTMDAAVAGAVRWLGVSVPEAVAMASAAPARLLGLGDRKGAIAPGFDADLVVLDGELRACGTMVAGRWVHGPPA